MRRYVLYCVPCVGCSDSQPSLGRSTEILTSLKVMRSAAPLNKSLCQLEHQHETTDGVFNILPQPGHRDPLNVPRTSARNYPLQLNTVRPTTGFHRLNGPAVYRSMGQFVSSYHDLFNTFDCLKSHVIKQLGLQKHFLQAIQPWANSYAIKLCLILGNVRSIGEIEDELIDEVLDHSYLCDGQATTFIERRTLGNLLPVEISNIVVSDEKIIAAEDEERLGDVVVK